VTERRDSVPADPLKIALYMQGTFYKPNANQQEMDAKLAAAKDIGGSGFGTVILGQWHVRPNGGIYYSDTPLDDVLQTLEVIPAVLKDGGSVRELLWLLSGRSARISNTSRTTSSSSRTPSLPCRRTCLSTASTRTLSKTTSHISTFSST
jgi:hypothetical protein